MKHILTLLLPFFLITIAHAEELHFYEHHCAITLPDTEAWQNGNTLRMPAGEMIFNSVNMETKQVVSIIVIPNFPTNNISTPAALTRFKEIITAQGFEMKTQKNIEWLGQPFMEIVGRRLNDASGELVSIMRATILEKTAYLVSTIGRGDERRMEDERFMRVISSFRFLDPDEKLLTATPLYLRYYRAGFNMCLIVMLVLTAAFTIMYIRTVRRH